jgi:hypothetical protein
MPINSTSGMVKWMVNMVPSSIIHGVFMGVNLLLHMCRQKLHLISRKLYIKNGCKKEYPPTTLNMTFSVIW